MRHCDPDDLALLALGEDVDVDREHLAGCADCHRELASLRSVVTSARSGQVEEVTPPPSVWAGIATATGAAVDTRPAAVRQLRTYPRRPEPDVAPARRWPTWALAAAAVAGLLLGGGVVAGLAGGGQDDVSGDRVAAADLEPLVEVAGTGSASVLEGGEGLVLQLSAEGLPEDADGYYEVWLLDEQAQRMVPLGVISDGSARLVVPADLDLSEYPVVDVSVEPFDGDPTHSGNSLLRGTLDI